METLIWAGLTLLLFNALSHGHSVKRAYGFHCNQLHSYNVLNNMLSHDTCMSANELFTYFSHLTNQGSCRTTLENQFAAKYPKGTKTPSSCTCTGTNVLHDYPSIGTNHNQTCQHDSNFMNIYNRYFHNHQTAPACSTHHTVWYDMDHASYSQWCQFDLIQHISPLFQHHDPCKCSVTEPTTPPTAQTTNPTGQISPHLPTQCMGNDEIKMINDMLAHDTCMSANELFTHLSILTSHSSSCRRTVEQLFAAKYPEGTNTPSNCTCHGTNVQHQYPSGGFHGTCKGDSHYMNIYNRYFHQTAPACSTHHTVWYDMYHAGYSNHCQYDLIHHISPLFQHHDPCKCSVTEPTTTPAALTTKPTGHIRPHLPTECKDIEEIKTLNLLMTLSGCHSIHLFWSKLQAIQTSAPECMPIVDMLADHFGKPAMTSCFCRGHTSGPNPFKGVAHHHTYKRCSDDPHYLALEHFLFEDHHRCVDTSIIWSPLREISLQGCRADFIQTAASKYSGIGADPCTCTHAALSPVPAIPFITTPSPTTTLKTTPIPTTPTTTTPTPTTPTTTTPTTTTPIPTTPTTTTPTTTTTTTTTIATTTTPQHTYHCEKFQAVQAVANHEVVTFANMTDCAPGGSNDGFVLQECNVTKTVSEWHRGIQVRPNCDQLQWYIPVAVFHHEATTYNPTGAQTGIFVGCLDNGFRMIVERCDGKGPVIMHIEDGGVFTQDPMNYYVIS